MTLSNIRIDAELRSELDVGSRGMSMHCASLAQHCWTRPCSREIPHAFEQQLNSNTTSIPEQSDHIWRNLLMCALMIPMGAWVQDQMVRWWIMRDAGIRQGAVCMLVARASSGSGGAEAHHGCGLGYAILPALGICYRILQDLSRLRNSSFCLSTVCTRSS